MRDYHCLWDMCTPRGRSCFTLCDNMILLTLLALSFANVGSGAYLLKLNSNRGIQWGLQNSNGSINVPATVPGGVYSDLQKAGVIDDILHGFNDVNTRWVSYDNWTYTANFNVSSLQLLAPVAHLVLKGVDTVALVKINEVPIAATNNMFARYVLDVKTHLKEGLNEIKVKFTSPVESARIRSSAHFTAPSCVPDVYHGECHANQLRKMQASFGWDWGPAFPSMGLWRPVFIEFYYGALIREVTTDLAKVGSQWKLKITAHLESSQSNKTIDGHIAAELLVNAHQRIVVANEIVAVAGEDGKAEAEITMTISENVVSLWWPNGYGPQPLYDLQVSVRTDKYPDVISKKHVKIGFRTVEVVEEKASTRFGNNTSAGEGLTFYFKVNGYPLFMKGSNWIPANILPEYGDSKDTVNNLLEAARDAHMSMLRVWGGGVYESDYFYQRCDQLGILIWQDFLFACSMYPADEGFLDTVKTEIVQNVLRLQHHASIAVWAGNNENEVALRGDWYATAKDFAKYKREYVKLYVDTIKPIVEALDPGRRYLVSSPSNGLESEKEGYIAENPYEPHYGDTHYYNYVADNWNPNTYPLTRFASEYGFQSLPSIFTMKTATAKLEDYNITSEYSKHRQHSPMGYESIRNQLLKHLRLDENDPDHFEKFVFYSQISQAMAMKTETEFYRQSQEDWFTMGALYWQLNDVWQAPSWSGIEYGGRWKMLHYYAKSFLAPVLVSPRLKLDEEIDVYLLNDRLVPIVDGKIRVDIFNWSTPFIPIYTKTYEANVAPLSSKKQEIALSLWDFDYPRDEIFLMFSLKSAGVHSSPYNFVFPVPLKDVKGLRSPKITLTVSEHVAKGRSGQYMYAINIRSDATVLFLWLETELEGTFDDNGFIVTNPHTRVNFLTKESVKPSVLEKTITYKYYLN